MDHIRLHDDYTAAGNCAHRQFLLARNAQLAHHTHIERETERTSHFECSRHASARPPQHNGIVQAWFLRDRISNHGAQRAASLPTVLKDDDHLPPFSGIDCSPRVVAAQTHDGTFSESPRILVEFTQGSFQDPE